MNEVVCRRCSSKGEPLPRAPLPGEAGEAVLAGSCRACWAEWLREQVRWMNELRLDPRKPEHYALLIAKMREYLKL